MELYSILKIKPSFKGTVEDVSPQMTGWVQCALSCCLTVQQLARVSAAPSVTRLLATTTHHLTTALVTIGNSDQDPTPSTTLITGELSVSRKLDSAKTQDTYQNSDSWTAFHSAYYVLWWKSYCILQLLQRFHHDPLLHVFVWIEYDRSFIQWKCLTKRKGTMAI